MVKYFDGRKCFLNTIELDTNRAESHGKRLQIKFERELETAGICKDILSASEEEESKEKSKHDDIDNVKSKLLEKVDYCDEGINIMCSSKFHCECHSEPVWTLGSILSASKNVKI